MADTPSTDPSPLAIASFLTAVAVGLGLSIIADRTGYKPSTTTTTSVATAVGILYLTAQTQERLAEIVAPLFGSRGTKSIDQKRANRAVAVTGALLIGDVVLSWWLGLDLPTAAGWNAPAPWLSLFITSLVLSGGTTLVHDAIAGFRDK